MAIVNPVSAGKLKALWDQVRTTPTPTDEEQAAPAPSPDPVPVQMGGDLPQAVLAAQPDPPEVRMAAPTLDQTPANTRVGQLQSQVDRVNAPPTLKDKLLQWAPIAASVIASAVTHGGAGASIRGVSEGMDQNREALAARRTNLTTQLSAAQQEREKEFDTAQNTVQRANAASDAAASRRDVAKILGGSRENVADTRSDATHYTADQSLKGKVVGAGASTYGADQRLTGTEYSADARERAAKYGADRADNRLDRSIAAGYGRQDRGFEHTDTKPTADEDKRADLSEAFRTYATELKEIATRRPELFGRAAGTSLGLKVRGMVHPDDADVRAIARIKENIGLVSQAAHSLRSAPHIVTAADKAADTTQNAESLIKNLDQGMKGLETFDTIHRPSLAGRVTRSRSGSGPAKPPTGGGKANDPLGIR